MKLINLQNFKKSSNLLAIITTKINAAHLSTPSTSSVESAKRLNQQHWQVIYKLPEINIFGGLSRLKLYQAAGTAISVPVAMGLESIEMIPNGIAELAGIVGKYKKLENRRMTRRSTFLFVFFFLISFFLEIIKPPKPF